MQFTIADNPHAAPHRPPRRAGVSRGFNSYAADTPAGRVVVWAWPFRPIARARAIARRIHADPGPYLWAARAFDLAGVEFAPVPAASAAAARGILADAGTAAA